MPLKYPTTSKTLLDKIASGDEIGWDEFYNRYRSIVLNLARYKGLSDAEADDVLQQVMLEFFKQSRTFRFDPDMARFRTFFGRIVRAKVSDYYRKHYRTPSEAIGERDFQDDAAPPDADADLVFLTEWRKTVLKDAKNQLKQRIAPETWQAYEMYALQNRPVEKVAAYLDCSVNQVYQAKKRCFALLREIILELNARDPELKLELLSHGL